MSALLILWLLLFPPQTCAEKLKDALRENEILRAELQTAQWEKEAAQNQLAMEREKNANSEAEAQAEIIEKFRQEEREDEMKRRPCVP